ncbi:MAG: toll/interleukin-1 receptor domain-containing protein [candidate division Zixibacteria bacterium]|nr:toll/interleukin-1 receptor domain-containing protein [candidate division Zixibacteria bacterium]
MKILLYSDNTIDIKLKKIVSCLNNTFDNIAFFEGTSKFTIKGNVISYPSTYTKLPKAIKTQALKYDLIICASDRRYDNNFFFEYAGNIVILSLHGWEYLSNVSVNNGFVYFVASLIGNFIGLRSLHEEDIGCISDFWMDKTSIDIGMKTGLICDECIRNFKEETHDDIENNILNSIIELLREIAVASKSDRDIFDYLISKGDKSKFDVFLCHNSKDKLEIREMNKILKMKNVKTWFDEEQIRPGTPWQDELMKNISNITCVAVFVGGNGIGPWEDIEIRAFISEFANRECIIIPVILEGLGDKEVPELPLILKQLMWVDFRNKDLDPLKRLLWGITGKKH